MASGLAPEIPGQPITMKFCQPHWDLIKKAIEERGLMQFVAGSGEKVISKMERELQGDSSTDTFDPLMAANFAIWSNAIDRGGLYLMGQKEGGSEYCPICESEAHNGPPADWWITHAADEQLEKAKALGLIRESVQ